MATGEVLVQRTAPANTGCDDVVNDVTCSPVSAADSTMNTREQRLTASSSSTLNTDDKSDMLSVRFLIERAFEKAPSPDLTWFVEVDTHVVVAGSLPWHGLIRHAMSSLGYSDLEAISCKASIVVKKWNPMPFDSVTDNWSVTVADILEDLTSLVTVNVKLTRSLQCCVIDDVKNKLLGFLLHSSSSQQLLVSNGCPIKQHVLKDLSSNDSMTSVSLPQDLVSSFHQWYKEHMPQAKSAAAKPSSGVSVSSAPTSFNGHATRAVGGHSARTTFDLTTEVPLLQNLFAEDPHPSKADMVRLARVLNSGRYRRPSNMPLDLSSIEHWFRTARAGNSTSPNDQESRSSDIAVTVSLPEDRSKQNKEVFDLNVGSIKTESDVGVAGESNGLGFSDGKITAVEGHQFESDKVCTSQTFDGHVGSSAKNVDRRLIDGCDSISRSTDVNSGGPKSKRRRRTTSWQSDENHNQRCRSTSSSMLSSDEEEVATDLSLRSNVTVASADCLPHRSFGAGSVDSASRKPGRPGPSSSAIKKETDASMLHAAMARSMVSPCSSAAAAGGPQFPFPSFLPHTLHQQMQMAVMTQAAMRYIQPLYAGAAIGHNAPSSAAAAAAFYQLAASTTPSCADEDTYHDSSSSTNGEMAVASGAADCRRKRSRVFIDPLSEIPRLEQWFAADSHPSAGLIEQLTDELNRSTYRQRFPKLEAKNVQLWFKNHRAKVKRQSVEGGSPTQMMPSSCVKSFVDKMMTSTSDENEMAAV